MNLHKFNSISEKLKSHQKLIAVSKGQDLEKIKQLYDIGHRDFGENFLQELKEKKAILPSDIRWHFLGNIQSNKVKDKRADELAFEISEKIQSEMTYHGQVKIRVIREKRSNSYAK